MRRPDAYREIRTLLKQARKDAELTQVELASRLSKPQSYISKYESGERRLDVVEFIAVAKGLGEDPAQMFKKILERDIFGTRAGKVKG